MSHNIAGGEGDCGRTTPCFLRLRLYPDYLKAPGSEPVDVILLDINMPEMNGFAFLEAYELTDTNQHARAVVVMLASSPDPMTGPVPSHIRRCAAVSSSRSTWLRRTGSPRWPSRRLRSSERSTRSPRTPAARRGGPGRRVLPARAGGDFAGTPAGGPSRRYGLPTRPASRCSRTAHTRAGRRCWRPQHAPTWPRIGWSAPRSPCRSASFPCRCSRSRLAHSCCNAVARSNASPKTRSSSCMCCWPRRCCRNSRAPPSAR